ncbi:ABC transporter permease [Nocardioides sp. SYSU DS0651]|uniref:ABC transporter permease n=1 Tax=Nocardioides sp. SYSU DS0651 TaxID=3415955 RepID=UPI003F4B6213
MTTATRTRHPGLPRWLVAPAALGAALVVLPVAALAARVDWGRLPALVTSDSALTALGLSLRTSAASTGLCLLLGVPLAVTLARSDLRALPLVRALVLLPLVLPPVVGGIALLAAFGRQGLLGGHLEALGMQVAFTTVAVVLAQTFVSLPFLVVSLEGALRTAGERYDVVAASLGARPTTVLRRVTLPLVLPGLASGTVLAFARSLGEFGATITFAGSLEGTTRTLPLLIYNLRVTDVDAAVAMSLVLVVVAVAVIGLVRPRVTS